MSTLMTDARRHVGPEATEQDALDISRDKRTKRLLGCTFRRIPAPEKKPWLVNKTHVWTSPLQERCHCGKLDRADTRLEEIIPGSEPSAKLCGRCNWSPAGEQEYVLSGNTESYYIELAQREEKRLAALRSR